MLTLIWKKLLFYILEYDSSDDPSTETLQSSSSKPNQGYEFDLDHAYDFGIDEEDDINELHLVSDQSEENEVKRSVNIWLISVVLVNFSFYDITLRLL